MSKCPLAAGSRPYRTELDSSDHCQPTHLQHQRYLAVAQAKKMELRGLLSNPQIDRALSYRSNPNPRPYLTNGSNWLR
jgi:hypothetical protein